MSLPAASVRFLVVPARRPSLPCLARGESRTHTRAHTFQAKAKTRVRERERENVKSSQDGVQIERCRNSVLTKFGEISAEIVRGFAR